MGSLKYLHGGKVHTVNLVPQSESPLKILDGGVVKGIPLGDTGPIKLLVGGKVMALGKKISGIYELVYITEKQGYDIIVVLLWEINQKKFYFAEYNLLTNKWGTPREYPFFWVYDESIYYVESFLVNPNGLYTSSALYSYPTLTHIIDGDSIDVNYNTSFTGWLSMTFPHPPTDDKTHIRKVNSIDFVTDYVERGQTDVPRWQGLSMTAGDNGWFFAVDVKTSPYRFVRLDNNLQDDIYIEVASNISYRGHKSRKGIILSQELSSGIWSDIKIYTENLIYIASIPRGYKYKYLQGIIGLDKSYSISETKITTIDAVEEEKRYIDIYNFSGELIEKREIISSDGHLKNG